MLLPPRPQGRNIVVKLFVILPMAAMAAAAPLAWGWGLTWTDVALAVFLLGLLLVSYRHEARRRGTPAP
jgi:stearoyl-CoA desaturase (delta-9 desaturase)